MRLIKKEKGFDRYVVEKPAQRIVAFSYAWVKLSTIVVSLGFNVNRISTNWHETVEGGKTGPIQVRQFLLESVETTVLSRSFGP